MAPNQDDQPAPEGGGHVKLTRGADYATADGHSLSWPVRTRADLAGAMARLLVYNKAVKVGAIVQLAVETSLSSGATAYVFPLTAAQTQAFTAGQHVLYEVWLTLASGRNWLEYEGTMEGV